MSRATIAAAGALVALGFLFASAVANYMFGASLGRTPQEAMLYGGVGVLAVAMNDATNVRAHCRKQFKNRATNCHSFSLPGRASAETGLPSGKR